MTGAPAGASPQLEAFTDGPALAAAAAARLLERTRAALAARAVAHLVLTGGGIGIATLAALADRPDLGSVDWSRVHLWWGDERFLEEGHPERNVTQARVLLSRLPDARVHPMPAGDGPFGDDIEAAAAGYASELAAGSGGVGSSGVPAFDVLMLGVGPDGHIASLFPGHPAAQETGRTVIPVRASPKPPPLRISLTRRALDAATEIWLLASGAEKAPAVREALRQAGADDGLPVGDPAPDAPGEGARLPSSLIHGRARTVWLVDRAALPDTALPDTALPDTALPDTALPDTAPQTIPEDPAHPAGGRP